MKYCVCFVFLVIVSACNILPTSAPASPPPSAQKPTPTLVPATPTPIPPKIKLIAYNYKIKDVGAGWNEGLVRLAFENISNDYIGGEKVDLSGATLETQEAKSYPVTLYQVQPIDPESQTQEIDFSKLAPVIPPHFRWTRLGISGETVKYNAKAGPYDLAVGEYYVRFRPATAAHPVQIVFPKRPDWKIDLSTAVSPTVAFPADALFLTPKPLSALAGRVLIDDPSKLKATLDGTGVFVSGSKDLQLKYTINNRDKLDAHSAAVELPIRAFFFGDGAVKLTTLDISNQTIQAGPGQTKQATWSLGELFSDKKCNPKVYALVQESAQYGIYSLNVCK